MAASAMSPPTSSDRSRPPTPITCDTPDPQRSSSVIVSCAPVPAAATTPIGPRATRFEKPSPTPPSTAVPAPGPITSLPSEQARCLSPTSSGRGTLSLKSSTSRPRVRALCASRAAYGPGTETRATLAPGASAKASSRLAGRGPAEAGESPSTGPATSNSTSLPACRAAARCSSDPRTARIRSFAAAPPRPSVRPSLARTPRLAGVAISAHAQSTPVVSPIARVASSSRTLST